jgi:hypothetical protein
VFRRKGKKGKKRTRCQAEEIWAAEVWTFKWSDGKTERRQSKAKPNSLTVLPEYATNASKQKSLQGWARWYLP